MYFYGKSLLDKCARDNIFQCGLRVQMLRATGGGGCQQCTVYIQCVCLLAIGQCSGRVRCLCSMCMPSAIFVPVCMCMPSYIEGSSVFKYWYMTEKA